MRLSPFLLSFAAILGLTRAARAAQYDVGPGKTYPNLGAVASMLKPGDLVLVDGGATYPSVVFDQPGAQGNPITIRGVLVGGQRPIISGGSNTVELQGDHYVFENFDVTGGSARCIYHHAADIVIRGSIVHDCPKQGILGGDYDTGSLTLETTEVHHCGGGTFDHQIYMATDETTHPGAVFRMQGCYVHDANGGNSVQTRAERNEIYGNWIEGAKYHELELVGPDLGVGVPVDLKREDSDIVGNVLRKTGPGATFHVIRTGGDGNGPTKGRFRFVNNTILVAPGGQEVFRIFDQIESIEMHNNVIYVPGGGSIKLFRDAEAQWINGPNISGSNNWLPTGTSLADSSAGVDMANWTGTIFGDDPGFANLGGFDLRPTMASPLVDKGDNAPMSASGVAFPNPLALPLNVPPAKTVDPALDPRPFVGTVDIGAYEFGMGGIGGASTSSTSTGGPTGGGASATSGTLSSTGGPAGPGSTGAGTSGAGGAGNGEGPVNGSCGCELPGSRDGSRYGALALLGLAIAALRVKRRRS